MKRFVKVKQQTSPYLPSRVLKLNVGFLLDGQTRSKDTELDLPGVRVADDLALDYVRGPVRLSRTKEGILVQSKLTVGVAGSCYRCLHDVTRPLDIQLEELYATSRDLSEEEAEFRLHEDGQLELAPLIRAEVLIKTTRGLRCEDTDACDERMRALEADAGIDHLDPRMAKLKELLEQQQDTSK